MNTNLSRDQWEQIVKSMEFYIDAEDAMLSVNNASEREWQDLTDVKSTLNDILLYVIPFT